MPTLSVSNLAYLQQRLSAMPTAAACMICLLLAACGSRHQDAWLHDKQAVLKAVTQTQTNQGQMADRLQGQEKRLLELESTVKKQSASLEAIKGSLEAIHARMQELAAANRSSSKLSKPHKTASESSLVKKLNKVEKSIAQVNPPAPPPPPQLTSEDEKNRYTAAYLALKSGRYDEAIATFQKLVKDFPKGQLTDQAYYWLGESYYAKGNLKSAIGAFKQVVANYPDSPKYTAALLRLGTAYKESGNPAMANAAFQRLIREHPDSPAAQNARSLMHQAAPARK